MEQLIIFNNGTRLHTTYRKCDILLEDIQIQTPGLAQTFVVMERAVEGGVLYHMPRTLKLILKHLFQGLIPSVNVTSLTSSSDMSCLPPKTFYINSTLMRLTSVI
jgi:hypothetical protein